MKKWIKENQKDIGLVMLVVGLCLMMLLMAGCTGTQKIPQTEPQPDIKPLDQQLVPTRQDWKDAYGDTLETQIVFNLTISRKNDLVIAEVMNRMHPADVNDPNNLKYRIEKLESVQTITEDMIKMIPIVDPNNLPEDPNSLLELREEDAVEGQARWIYDSPDGKKGHLEIYNGKEWIGVEDD